MTEAFGSTADAARILPLALDTAAVTAKTVATTMTTTATIGVAKRRQSVTVSAMRSTSNETLRIHPKRTPEPHNSW
jgi:hypothetical protein